MYKSVPVSGTVLCGGHTIVMAVLCGGPGIDDIGKITLVFDRMNKDSLVGCRVDDQGQRY